MSKNTLITLTSMVAATVLWALDKGEAALIMLGVGGLSGGIQMASNAKAKK